VFAAVERHHRQAGHAIWPTPRVRDFAGWLREQHALRELRESGSCRCLSSFEEQELWRGVVLESPASADFLEPAGAARAAREAWRALHEHGIPLHALEAHPTEEVRALSDWITRFEARCRALHAISGATLLAGFEGPPPPLAWLESPAWRPSARRWLERHGGPSLAPGRVAPMSGASGGGAPGAAASAGAAALLTADSADAELSAAAGWARQWLDETPDFRAWICIPDLPARRAQAVDAFDAALAPQRFALSPGDSPAPYAVAGGTPLADYAPVRAAIQLLESCVGLVPFERFSALLRSPELQPDPAAAAVAAALDVALRSRSPREAPLAEWLALAADLGRSAAVARLRLAHEALGSVRGHQPLSRWIGVWVAAFECAPWAMSARWSSGEFQAAERLRELLGELAAGDALHGGQSLQSALRILAAAARDTPFQPQTGVTPIAVGGQLQDPWLTYDGVWIAGMQEIAWPPPVRPVPLLPVRLQREFGIAAASAAGQLAFARDLQARWLARTPRCVFSHARPGDGSRASPSPLLPADLRPLAGAGGGASARPHPLWRGSFAKKPPLERLVDDRAPPFRADVETTHGVSTLRAQSRCAFRGFAETRLRGDRLVMPAPGFDERERGNLVHLALERVWSVLQSSPILAALPAADEERLLADATAQALALVCARRDPGPRWRLRETARLQGLLGEWLRAERRREPFAVERLERPAETVRHGGLEFSIRIDRIDRLADGARVLIDYKTGTVNADWRGERPDNPQLPVYALAHRGRLVAAAYGRVSVGECGFVAETERRGVFKAGARPSNLEGQRSLADLLDAWALRIEGLAGAFAAGEAAVAPTARACQTCHLQGLCRVSAFADGAGDD
jgi:probable DNA repair protein